MQSLESLDDFYKVEDPWNYTKTKDDKDRKKRIINHLKKLGPFRSALDIGAGEGFITTDIPADVIHAVECSDNASMRLPENVTRVIRPTQKYDLVLATGVLYPQYDWQRFHGWINHHAQRYVLTSSIKDWEIPINCHKQVHEEEYPYREFTQILRIYEV